MDYTFKKINEVKGDIEIEVNVKFIELDKFKNDAFSILSKDVKIEGFRPGKAPKNLIEEKLGGKLITEAISRLVTSVSFEIIEKENFKPTNQPQYDVKDLDPEKGIVFTFKFTNYPDVELGDFGKIKITKSDVLVEDKDVDEVVKSVIKSNVKIEKIKELTTVKEIKAEKEKDDKETPASFDFELNDAVVKELGYEKEDTLEKVRAIVKERLLGLKKDQSEEEYLNKMVDEAVKLSKFEIPEAFIESEIHNSEHAFTHRLEDLHLDADTYLKTQNKTLEDLRADWKKQAEQRIAIDLVLISLATKHDLLPNEEDVTAEISALSSPDARAQYETDNGKDYIRTVITRRKGLEKLKELVEGKK